MGWDPESQRQENWHHHLRCTMRSSFEVRSSRSNRPVILWLGRFSPVTGPCQNNFLREGVQVVTSNFPPPPFSFPQILSPMSSVLCPLSSLLSSSPPSHSLLVTLSPLSSPLSSPQRLILSSLSLSLSSLSFGSVGGSLVPLTHLRTKHFAPGYPGMDLF